MHLIYPQADVDPITDDDETPMFHAMTSHSLDCARILLQHGANVNYIGR